MNTRWCFCLNYPGVKSTPAVNTTLLALSLLLAVPSAGRAANLFVANSRANNIVEYTSSGGVLNGNGTVFANAGLNYPVGLAFDNAGNLYVANYSGSNIVKYTSSGAVLNSNSTVFANAGLNGPAALAFDSIGNLYVANNLGNTIEEFAFSGGVLTSTGTVFASAGLLDGPGGLAFDSAGNLYAASANNNTIIKFSFSGGALSTNGAVFASSAVLLSEPTGLAFDSAGNLYVANEGFKYTFTNILVKFSSSGGELSSNGTVFVSGLGMGLFYPYGMAFDGAGDLYVGNTGGNTIEKFTCSGGVLSSNGSAFASGLLGPQQLAFQPVFVSAPTNLTISAASGGITLMFSTTSNNFYDVQTSTDLVSSGWSTLVSNIVGNGGTTNYVDIPSNVPQKFYRVYVHF